MELADPLITRPGPPPGGRWTAHPGLLGVLTVLGPVSMDLYLPGLPDVSQSLGLGREAASATLFACLAGLAVGQVLWGQVIDRHGNRRPLLLATLATAAGVRTLGGYGLAGALVCLLSAGLAARAGRRPAAARSTPCPAPARDVAA